MGRRVCGWEGCLRHHVAALHEAGQLPSRPSNYIYKWRKPEQCRIYCKEYVNLRYQATSS
jgi:hypothetical protein